MDRKEIREEWILQKNDEIRCKNGDCYRITGSPVGYGGSSVLYPAEKISEEENRILYVIKECFPVGETIRYIRKRGKIVPDIDSVEGKKQAERIKAEQYLKLREEAFRVECQVGQEISRMSDRVIIAREILDVCCIKTAGKEEHVENVIFLGMERKDKQGVFLPEILEECKKEKKEGHPFRTGGLPNIYTTARMIEQVLKAVDLVHKAGNGGYLHGDIHDGNIYFSDFRPEEGKEGDIGFGCLLDFGNVRELYVTKYDDKKILRTDQIARKEICTTHGFTPPEIDEKQDGYVQLGPEADIYSVGRLLLYLLTGEKYYDYEKKQDLVKTHGEKKQLTEAQCNMIGCSLTLRQCVNKILKKSLELKRQNRYHSAQEMLQDVYELVYESRPAKRKLNLKLPTLSEKVFTGREQEIRQLNRCLTEKYNPIILSGFGGIGKTELAIEFGRRIMMKSRDRNVYFVRFQESFRKTIVGPIAEAFSGYSKFDENNKLKSEDLIFEEVIKLLGELNSDDILIIDNVDDAKKGFHELRAGDDHGKSLNTLLGCLNVILTTRDNQSDSVEIMEMNEEELILLTQKLGLRCERERLLPLISLVNNHTLTVELCARTLIHTPNLTPEALYNILLEGEYSSIELKQVDTLKDREYEHARIEVHLRKLFQIAELDMEEQKVLSNALLLPVRGIERELFMKALLLTDSKKIEHLIERGWIKHDKANDIVLVHPLINSICRKTEEISPTIERCKTYIWWVDSWIRKSTKPLLKTQYEQVAKCAYAYFESMVEVAENQMLMNSLGYYYFLSGDYKSSKEYYIGARKRSKQYGSILKSV